MKTVSCKDAGVTNCEWKATGQDEEEVLRKANSHFRREHGISVLPSDMTQKIRQSIHDEDMPQAA